MSKSLERGLLWDYFKKSLGEDCLLEPVSNQPYGVYIPSIGVNFDVYLWNVITMHSGSKKRPPNEYRMNFNIHPRKVTWKYGVLPVYCGYCADYDVFVLWDSRRHEPDLSWGNLQIKQDPLIQGSSKGYALYDRFVTRGVETIIVCSPKELVKAFSYRYSLYLDDLCSGRQDTTIGSFPKHNEYGIIYRHCKNNPDQTIFEVAYNLQMTVEEIKRALTALHKTFDYPRDPDGDEERRFLEMRLEDMCDRHPNLSVFEVLEKLHVPLEYAIENRLV